MKNNRDRVIEIKAELLQLESRRQILLSELNELSTQDNKDEKQVNFLGKKAFRKEPETPEEKIELFLTLFCARRDVFPSYWENKKTGKKGYSPVCSNEWKYGVCFKPKVKCRACSNQSFISFDASSVKDHLMGKTAMGSYAINNQDKSVFLAADFDKSTWREDIRSYNRAAAEMNIQVATEISKSGNGAHAWIFFKEHVPAKKARRLGEIILSRAMECQNNFNLDSYDRFFPNQDLLPSGGFGNLIALPLQRNYRNNGFCVFLDFDFNIISNQWEYLSQLHCLTENDLDNILNETALYTHNLDPLDAMKVAESILKNSGYKTEVTYTGKVTLTIKGQISIPLKVLPAKIILKLKKSATFANPTYFEAQRMRFSTWNIPKYIFCGDNDSMNLYLPRGLLPQIQQILKDYGFAVSVEDLRNSNNQIDISFSGTLFEYQRAAAVSLQKKDNTVLVAPTGTGKTIIALYMISLRKSKTLILVHRSTLIEQWINALCDFIPEIKRKDIGVLGAGRKKLKGTIDIAMLQSIANIENLEERTTGYDFLIIDECHRVPTVTFEPVLKTINARYILGLTATPHRKDRFESIIFMQCGPIAYTVEDVNLQSQERKVFFRNTELPGIGNLSSIQELWEYLIESEERNEHIGSDLLNILSENRSPLIISDRTEHLDILIELLKGKTDASIFTLKGTMGKKEKKETIAAVRDHIDTKKQFCLFSTGSLIGEGFDLPELDTMVITMPISFKGRLTQYVGRLHRQNSPDKKEIAVYDYVDTCSGMTISMFKKRLSAYKRLGYIPVYDPGDKIARWI
jgi:superfamily II DNA or RNA helicase